MKTIKIVNGTILTGGKAFIGNIVLKGGKIDYVGTQNPEVEEDAHVIDAKGQYVAPGFIDLHTHGAGGADFMDGTVEAYLTAARMHAIHGTTLLYPTTLTSTNEALYGSFETYNKAEELNVDGARFGGMHLEGPYFNPVYAGAQDPRYLRNPRPEEYIEILENVLNLHVGALHLNLRVQSSLQLNLREEESLLLSDIPMQHSMSATMHTRQEQLL